MATHSSILAWRIPWMEEPRKDSDTTEQLHFHFTWWFSGKEFHLQCRRPGYHSWVGKIPWRQKGQPTPVKKAVHGPLLIIGKGTKNAQQEKDSLQKLVLGKLDIHT